jgi:S-DNA-T family DNA segregation ATPase FtsK/SpoIIIE
MAKKNNKKTEAEYRLHPDTKKSIWAVVFTGVAIILVLAGLGKAGPAGELLFEILRTLLGAGYFILPLSFLLVAGVLLVSERRKIIGTTLLGAAILVLSLLGLIELISYKQGGWLGLVLGSLRLPFGETAALVINVLILIVAILITLNVPIRFRRKIKEKNIEEKMPVITEGAQAQLPAAANVPFPPKDKTESPKEEFSEEKTKISPFPKIKKWKGAGGEPAFLGENYIPPPPELLKSGSEKPTTGDLRANANIIKRTLESFGIQVEMGEINIGPKVTRYTLKPAEGIKLSRITALNQDLALALAAHPIRIEAPIPGKSLVGIEVPNKAAALVRLGNLMAYPEFQTSGLLGFALGRDVMGEPIFADIERMPHLLISGATGSGKSVCIHSLLVSLLYKNSPATLRLILIDPKRVELTIYENLPHLVSPVITESKKAANVFRWAIKEMERRYDLLQQSGNRDIKSYNINGGKKNPLPYLLIVVDELADLMTSYGREVEGSIVRLAQMARATGLHLILSTQRPSVEIITGLIKANITNRIALQVASQVDSRTILDTGGAEKLLGGGDLLFVSTDFSKPKRIQGAYISEEETNKVAEFIRENNRSKEIEEINFGNGEGAPFNDSLFADYSPEEDDELLEEAIRLVGMAKKASASLLQRRLKVGYARAARLLDLMEEKGIIGPGEGAKPREVFLEKIREEKLL